MLVQLKVDVAISSDKSVAKSHSLNHGRRAAAFFWPSSTSFKTLLLTSAAFLISSSEKLLPSTEGLLKTLCGRIQRSARFDDQHQVLLELAPCRVRVLARLPHQCLEVPGAAAPQVARLAQVRDRRRVTLRLAPNIFAWTWRGSQGAARRSRRCSVETVVHEVVVLSTVSGSSSASSRRVSSPPLRFRENIAFTNLDLLIPRRVESTTTLVILGSVESRWFSRSTSLGGYHFSPSSSAAFDHPLLPPSLRTW